MNAETRQKHLAGAMAIVEIDTVTGEFTNAEQVIDIINHYTQDKELAREIAYQAARRKRYQMREQLTGWRVEPHKGGRDQLMNFRISADLKDWLRQFADDTEQSMADVLEAALLDYRARRE